MKRNQSLIKKVFQRDGFSCQKCKIQDKTSKILEAHHIIPLVLNREDKLDNLVTLCKDCHHFAPNNKEEFDDYLKEECTGTMPTLIKSMSKVREEHPDLFDKVGKKLG